MYSRTTPKYGYYTMERPRVVHRALVATEHLDWDAKTKSGELFGFVERIVKALGGGDPKYKFSRITDINYSLLATYATDKSLFTPEEMNTIKYVMILLNDFWMRLGRADFDIKIVDYREDPSMTWEELCTFIAYSELGDIPIFDIGGPDKLVNIGTMTVACCNFLIYFRDFAELKYPGVSDDLKGYLNNVIYNIATDEPGGITLDQFDNSFLQHAISLEYGSKDGYAPKPVRYDGTAVFKTIDKLKAWVEGGTKYDMVSLASNGDFEHTVSYKGITTPNCVWALGIDLSQLTMFRSIEYLEEDSIPWGVEHELNATFDKRIRYAVTPSQWYELNTSPYRTSQGARVGKFPLSAGSTSRLMSISQFSELPKNWKGLNDVSGMKYSWNDRHGGKLVQECFINWRGRYVDGDKLTSEIMFDRTISQVLANKGGERIEQTTPAMALLPPTGSMMMFTDAAEKRLIYLKDEDFHIPIHYYDLSSGKIIDTPKVIDVSPYYKRKGNVMWKQSFAEYRTTTMEDIRTVKNQRVFDYAMDRINLDELNRIASTPMIEADIARWQIKLMTGNDVTLPDGISWEQILTTLRNS